MITRWLAQLKIYAAGALAVLVALLYLDRGRARRAAEKARTEAETERAVRRAYDRAAEARRIAGEATRREVEKARDPEQPRDYFDR